MSGSTGAKYDVGRQNGPSASACGEVAVKSTKRAQFCYSMARSVPFRLLDGTRPSGGRVVFAEEVISSRKNIKVFVPRSIFVKRKNFLVDQVLYTIVHIMTCLRVARIL